jgi:uncharacterized membrane protein YhaH (DUF805 family)
MTTQEKHKTEIDTNKSDKDLTKERGKILTTDTKKEEPSRVEVKQRNFGNPFSFRGRSGRLDYMLYGVLLGFVLAYGGFFLGAKLQNPILFFGALIVGVVMGIAATVRRARDLKENIILTVLFSMIPYINILVMLYLLLMPGKWKKTEHETADDDKMQPLGEEAAKQTTGE